jgi:hypothetical protein
MLVIGFVLVSCDTGTNGDSGIAKNVVVENIDGAYDGKIGKVDIYASDGSTRIATGGDEISSGTLSVQLKDNNNQNWQGSGNYYIQLRIENSSTVYFVYDNQTGTPVVYNIVNETTSFNFDYFKQNP